MFQAAGCALNFTAILIPTLMALYYGFRCLVQTDKAIAEWGIGPAAEQIVKVAGAYALAQGIMLSLIHI